MIIFLAGVYLFSATGLSEFSKINILLQHYTDTKKENIHISFIEFLVEHYLTDDGNPKDDDTDSKLPFKSYRTCSSLTVIFTPIGFMEKISAKYDVISIHFFLHDDMICPATFYSMVWHPPKVS